VAGQAPGVVKIRLSGAVADIQALAALAEYAAAAGGGFDLIEVSQPYPNRREAGARLYLTIRIAAGQPGPGTPPPGRSAAPRQLPARTPGRTP
jgi:hypothetical protein